MSPFLNLKRPRVWSPPPGIDTYHYCSLKNHYMEHDNTYEHMKTLNILFTPSYLHVFKLCQLFNLNIITHNSVV